MSFRKISEFISSGKIDLQRILKGRAGKAWSYFSIQYIMKVDLFNLSSVFNTSRDLLVQF